MQVKFARTVGVAPGTTTLNLQGLRDYPTKAVIRWDLIGLVSGLSLLVGLTASTLAARFGVK